MHAEAGENLPEVTSVTGNSIWQAKGLSIYTENEGRSQYYKFRHY